MNVPRPPRGLCLSLVLSLGFATSGANAQPAYEVADLGAPVTFHWDDWNATNAIVEANGLMFFFQNDGSNGRELWRSDGTALGTFLIRDLCPGSCGSRFPNWSDMAPLGDRVVFAADDGVHGLELWITDGTAVEHARDLFRPDRVSFLVRRTPDAPTTLRALT